MESIVIGRWPQEAQRRAEFANRKVPCLWLVERTAEPPIIEPWEDWVRLPSSEREVEARARTLTERACRPTLVDGVVLRNTFGSVALPASESAIVELLLHSDRQLVPRVALEAAVWPGGAPTSRSLDDLIYRLRRRIKPLRLTVFSARERGFIMGVELELSQLPKWSSE